jgi:uncharacterized protein (DUF2336 family)
LKLTRAGNTYQARLALAKRMHAARQRKAMARLVAYLRDQVVLLDLATTDVERAKVLGKIYQRGRHDGHSAAYWRYVTNVRKSA